MVDNAYIGLGVLLFCIVLFVIDRIPTVLSAILGCLLMVFLGVARYEDVFGQFASPSVVMVISMMILGNGMFESGAAVWIEAVIMRLSGGNERRLLIVSAAIAALLSALMSNVVVLVMMISIFTNLARINKNINLKYYIITFAVAVNVGGVATMIGSAPQMNTQALLEESLGSGFAFFDYSLVGIPMIILMVIYISVIGIPLGKKLWSQSEITQSAEAVQTMPQANQKKASIMLILFISILLLLFFEPFPIAVILAAGALISILIGCVTPHSAMKSISWSSVLKLGAFLGIMNAIRISGGADLIAKFIFDAIGEDISPYLLLLFAILVAQLISEFMANSAAMLIVLPVMLSLCAEKGLNPYCFAMAITLASSSAISCPLSNTSLTIASSYGYKFSDFFRFNFLLGLLLDVVIFVLTPLFFPIM